MRTSQLIGYQPVRHRYFHTSPVKGFLLGCIFILLGCHTKTEPQSITVNGKSVSSFAQVKLVSNSDTLLIPEIPGTKNIILVRHAEKDTVGKNPHLTADGKARAHKLAQVLANTELDQIYSTKYHRTIETAEPSAVAQMTRIKNYGGFDHDQVIAEIINDSSINTALIVGHSNTTANFLNAMIATHEYDHLSEDAYSDLFIVQVRSVGDAQVLNLKY